MWGKRGVFGSRIGVSAAYCAARVVLEVELTGPLDLASHAHSQVTGLGLFDRGADSDRYKPDSAVRRVG